MSVCCCSLPQLNHESQHSISQAHLCFTLSLSYLVSSQLHPSLSLVPPSSSIIMAEERSGSGVCNQFLRYGSCKFGDRCRYSHSSSTSTSTARGGGGGSSWRDSGGGGDRDRGDRGGGGGGGGDRRNNDRGGDGGGSYYDRRDDRRSDDRRGGGGNYDRGGGGGPAYHNAGKKKNEKTVCRTFINSGKCDIKNCQFRHQYLCSPEQLGDGLVNTVDHSTHHVDFNCGACGECIVKAEDIIFINYNCVWTADAGSAGAACEAYGITLQATFKGPLKNVRCRKCGLKVSYESIIIIS
jgi:hypothetical protein